MRHVLVFCCCLCCLVGIVSATDVVAPTDVAVPSSGPAPTVPEVAIDDQSIQDIADALAPVINPPTDPTNPTDPVVTDPPQVDLSADAVQDIAGAVGAAVADAVAPDPSDSVPVLYASGGIVGGYYFVADCALGQGVKFWVPADFAQGSITMDSSGSLVNMTNSTIYLMPDDSTLNSSYTIQAPRFSSFQYRRDASGYGWSDLDISNISNTNISWLDDTPQAVPISRYFVLIASILVIGFLFLFVFKRG